MQLNSLTYLLTYDWLW